MKTVATTIAMVNNEDVMVYIFCSKQIFTAVDNNCLSMGLLIVSNEGLLVSSTYQKL